MVAPLVTVRGLREWQNALVKAAGQDVKKELKAAYKAIGEGLTPGVRSAAPAVSGALAGSVRAAQQIGGPAVRIGGGSVPYAGVVMFASKNGRRRNPFPYRVIEARLGWVVDKIIEALDRLAERINA